MPFAKGTPKPAGSGRKRGQTNKFLFDARRKLEELNCDPIEGMARIAMDTGHTPELRGHMFGRLAKFVCPELRATDFRFVDQNGKDRPLQLSDLDRIASDVSE